MFMPWQAAQFCEYTPPPFDACSAVNTPGACGNATKDSATVPITAQKTNLDKSAVRRISDLLISNST
jgi:hypothetical protein